MHCYGVMIAKLTASLKINSDSSHSHNWVVVDVAGGDNFRWWHSDVYEPTVDGGGTL